ncbi:MAG: periplasmic heavy metal sensor [Sulfitobacter sp.]
MKDSGDMRKLRWMPIVLGISLAINLVVVAALAGAAWRHSGEDRGMDRGDGPRASRGGMIYMQALPSETRKQIRENLRAERRPRPDATTMIAALRQVPFDDATAADILETERGASLERQGRAGDVWLAEVRAMTGPQRAAYADRLEELSNQRKARRDKRRGADQ